MGRKRQFGTILLLTGAWPACVLAGPAGKPARGVRAYSADFGKRVGPEWSATKTDVTPKGRRRFLGQFSNDEVRLTLKGLPEHQLLRVSFELFVIRSWDGSVPRGDPGRRGPDLWQLCVADGPALLRCTFAEYPAPTSRRQSFPDDFPGPSYERRTGAAEVGSLGYHHGDEDAHDAVYRLSFVFAHAGPEVTLVFSAEGLQELTDESWGLDNVTVDALPEPLPLTDDQRRRHWQQLLGDDPVEALRSRRRLAAAGDPAAAMALAHLKRAEPDAETVGRLIRALDSDEWWRREDASAKLRRMGRAVVPLLRKALEGDPSPEVAVRLRRLVQDLGDEQLPPKQQARLLRILRLLEAIGSKTSVEGLAILRRDGPNEEIRSLARAACNRAAEGLIRRLLARADDRAGTLDFAAAMRLAGEALSVAQAADSLQLEWVQWRLARLGKLRQVSKELAPLQDGLRARPDDRAARERLIRTYLIELDCPAEAAKWLDARSEASLRKHVPLAAGDPAALTAEQCLALAEWYRGLAGGAGALGRPAMLRRARDCYARYVGLLAGSAAQAQGRIGRIEQELMDAGARPWANLLGRVAPERHRLLGQWRTEGTSLAVSPAPYARLTVPVAPRGSYELAVEFTRKSGTGDVNIVLPVGATGVVLCLDDRNGNSGLMYVGGRDFLKPDGPHTIPIGSRQRLGVAVRRMGREAEVRVRLNGKEYLRWRGPEPSLSVRKSWAVAHGQALGLGAHESEVVFHSLRLRMLSGRAKPLELKAPPARPPLEKILRDLRIGPGVIMPQPQPIEPPFPIDR